jgi:hypothetical protein
MIFKNSVALLFVVFAEGETLGLINSRISIISVAIPLLFANSLRRLWLIGSFLSTFRKVRATSSFGKGILCRVVSKYKSTNARSKEANPLTFPFSSENSLTTNRSLSVKLSNANSIFLFVGFSRA